MSVILSAIFLPLLCLRTQQSRMPRMSRMRIGAKMAAASSPVIGTDWFDIQKMKNEHDILPFVVVGEVVVVVLEVL